MNQFRVLLVLLFSFFFYNVKAQDQSNHSNTHAHKPLHPSLAVVIGILAVMFSLTFLIVAYAKFCNTVVIDHFTNDQAGRGLVRSRSSSSGIDKKLIESLPFFRFSSLTGSKEGLECVVCLSKFEDDEVLRLLPKCKHAFHLTCIDKWLESHSSCPLCRYKFDVSELTNFTFTNSLRYNENPLGLNEGLNFEVFVQREQDKSHRSTRYNLGSSFRKFGKFKKEELLIQENEREFLHKFKHKIIVSDIVYKSRWSDVNSSDFVALNSEMINAMSSKRFSPLSRNTERFHLGFSPEEHIVKIKEDMGRKRFFESRVGKFTRSNSVSTSSFPSTSIIEANPPRIIRSYSVSTQTFPFTSTIEANPPRITRSNTVSTQRFPSTSTIEANPRIPRSNSVSTSSFPSSSTFARSNLVSTSNFPSTSTIEENQNRTSRSLIKSEKRSMSEIINFSRFTQFSSRNRTKESPFFITNNGKEEKMRRIWFPIAKQTIQWFAGRERSSFESETKRHPSNV